MSDAVCCTKLERGDTWPFEIVAIGWYDGITSGMARCGSCRRSYHFEMVAWDDEQEVRVFGFQPVSAASYDAVAALDATPVTPAEALKRADELTVLVRNALATSFERTLYIATTDASKSILAARTVGIADWRDWLGW